MLRYRHLFFLLFAAFFFFQTKVAYAAIDQCLINLYTDVPGINPEDQMLMTSTVIDGSSGTLEEERYYMPFDVPIRMEVLLSEDSGTDGCTANDREAYLTYRGLGDDSYRNSARIGDDCRAELHFTVDMDWLLHAGGTNPYFRLTVEDSCRLEFYFRSERTDGGLPDDINHYYPVHRLGYYPPFQFQDTNENCHYPETCQTEEEEEGVKMCLGTLIPYNSSVPAPGQFVVSSLDFPLIGRRINRILVPQDIGGGQSRYHTGEPAAWSGNVKPWYGCAGSVNGVDPIQVDNDRCGECQNDCAIICFSGCTMEDASCQKLQQLRDSGYSSCGNGLCEAGEEAPDGGVGCQQDCNINTEDPTQGYGAGRSSQLCEQLSGDENNPQSLRGKCKTCLTGGGIWTAIGCIPTSPQPMMAIFIRLGLSMGGGIALISIVAAGFMFTTSQGDPQKTSSAKELMTSAIIGLLFIIFSVTILRFIAADFIKIPGFGI